MAARTTYTINYRQFISFIHDKDNQSIYKFYLFTHISSLADEIRRDFSDS